MPVAHIPALDGIRGVALLTVFLCHTHPILLAGGHVGVDLFFVLSGFLITSLLLAEFSERGAIDFRRFYIRRALRLLPALFAMVAITLVYVAIVEPDKMGSALRDARAIVFYYFNYRRAIDIIQPVRDTYDWFGHLWSLSVEEQFYIVWPLVLLLALRARSPLWLGLILLGGLVGPAIGRIVLWEEGPSLWLYFRTELRFDNLMWGVLGAWLLWTGRIQESAVWRHAGVAMALVATAVFFVVSYFPVVYNGFLYMGGYTLVGLVSMVMILSAATAPPQLLRWLLELPFMRWTGKISYGLYIWHIPVFYSAFKLPVHEYVQSTIGIVGTYAVAAASYYYLELPFLKTKDKLSAKRARPAEAA